MVTLLSGDIEMVSFGRESSLLLTATVGLVLRALIAPLLWGPPAEAAAAAANEAILACISTEGWRPKVDSTIGASVDFFKFETDEVSIDDLDFGSRMMVVDGEVDEWWWWIIDDPADVVDGWDFGKDSFTVVSSIDCLCLRRARDKVWLSSACKRLLVALLLSLGKTPTLDREALGGRKSIFEGSCWEWYVPIDTRTGGVLFLNLFRKIVSPSACPFSFISSIVFLSEYSGCVVACGGGGAGACFFRATGNFPPNDGKGWWKKKKINKF